MNVLRRRSFLASTALAVLLVIASGLYLARSEASANRDLRHEFAGRVGLTARLADNLLSAALEQNRVYVNATYNGPEAALQAAVDANQADDKSETVIVSGNGRVLGSSPHGLAR